MVLFAEVSDKMCVSQPGLVVAVVLAQLAVGYGVGWLLRQALTGPLRVAAWIAATLLLLALALASAQAPSGWEAELLAALERERGPGAVLAERLLMGLLVLSLPTGGWLGLAGPSLPWRWRWRTASAIRAAPAQA